MEEKNKKCPACAEDIKFEAKKCRYCGELLDKTINEPKDDKKENKGGFLKFSLIIFAILFIFGGLSSFGSGDFIYGFSLIIIGIGLIPQIKQKINIKFENVKNFNLIYGIILFIILIIGVNNSNTLEKKNENIIEKNSIKEFDNNSIIETKKVEIKLTPEEEIKIELIYLNLRLEEKEIEKFKKYYIGKEKTYMIETMEKHFKKYKDIIEKYKNIENKGIKKLLSEMKIKSDKVINIYKPLVERLKKIENRKKFGIDEKICKSIKNGDTREKVLEILGKPTSKSESTIQGIGKTELFIFQIGTAFDMENCTITLTNGNVSMTGYTKL